jgi:hypothetical protein
MSSTEGGGTPEAPKKIAVMFIHGIGTEDPDYADNATRILVEQFEEVCGGMPHPELVVEAVDWNHGIDEGLGEFMRDVLPPGFPRWSQWLNRLVHQIYNVCNLAMLPLGLSALLRWVPGLPKANWPTLRWFFVYFVGDVVAYQPGPGDKPDGYTAIHQAVDDTLDRLAKRAPRAPLCVIAHSLGSVIASDHFYDLQRQGDPSQEATVRAATPPPEDRLPLTFFYTLGSPIALWRIRYREFDRPVRLVSANYFASAEAVKAAQWINFYDPDDFIAYPLKPLSDEYDAAVNEDRTVHVGPPILGSTPLSHVAYFNSRRIMRAIAEQLAQLV